MANYGWKACPASLHKRIARMRTISYDANAGATLAKVAEKYAREGQCAMARATLRASIRAVRKALKRRR